MTAFVGSQPNEIHAISYNRASAALRRAIALLQHRAFSTPPPSSGLVTPEHDPVLDALSFYLIAVDRVASYAAVVHKTILYGGVAFEIAGLSCVATDPDYQGRGFGSRVVTAATRAIEHSTVDFGVFTCDAPLVPFYTRAGAWQAAPEVELIGSQHAGALTSRGLRKAVLIRLFSEKAHSRADQLLNTTIDLDLPVGQFL
jgi:ribosomal protein S18 acetylase RimI-like enzyme